MRVAIISKAGRYKGGASQVAADLATWLNEAGHSVVHFVAYPAGDGQAFPKSLYGEGWNLKLCQTVHKFTRRFGFKELIPMEYFLNLRGIIADYDVVHFHDLFTAIAPATLALVARHKPTFFTVHDCSAFTGGCLYPMECEKFITACQQCPQLGQDTWKQRLRDRTREIQATKRYITKKFPIQYIYPSNWISQQAALALQYRVPSMVIPNAVDLVPFNFANKLEAKSSLGIAGDRQVILISALSLDDQRKGAKYAVAALQSVTDLNPLVITVGKPSPELRQALDGLEVMEMGFVSDPDLMAKIYSASEVMLFCSLADNLPLTILEAMAGAAVVVGFATGGIPDMINSGVNGILVEPKNQEKLDAALRQILLSEQLAAMGKQARLDVEAKFSKSLFVERHLEMYSKFLK